jgi:hypothetical protein
MHANPEEGRPISGHFASTPPKDSVHFGGINVEFLNGHLRRPITLLGV